uniref:Putative methyltransferase n=1 Tax=viral metagenome TaxID=1070528 RepID=A0A6M3J0N6_9ZZZZ
MKTVDRPLAAQKILKNKLRWLNAGSNTSKLQLDCIEMLLQKFPEHLTLLEIGSAYGGGVEMMAKMVGDRGTVYGYDTFEGHPRDLAVKIDDPEAYCMDMWYNNPMWGTKDLNYEYQREILDEEGLDNAILVKGRLNENSFDDIEKAHFVLMDLDMVNPSKIAYKAIKDKIVPGGFLFMHDIYPPHNLPHLHKWAYKEVVPDPMWVLEGEFLHSYLAILRRKETE